MYYLPISLLELFLGEFNEVDELKIKVFRSQLDDNTWCKSKYTKKIIAESNKLMPKFLDRFYEKRLVVNFKNLQLTLKLYEQFLSFVEIKALSEDLLALIEETLQTDVENYNSSSLSSEKKESFSKLIEILNPTPSRMKSLSTLMMELPFFIFIEVAKADGQIDKRERLKFVECFREREWCKSECCQYILLSTDYGYDELFAKYNRHLLKFDFKQIIRTLHMMEDVFMADEVTLVKSDLITLASEVGKASGGFAGIKSICDDERESISKLQGAFDTLKIAKRSTSSSDLNKQSGPPQEMNPEMDALRAQPRVYIPNTDIILLPERKGINISLLNISKYSILCKIEFTEHYQDVLQDIRLSFKFKEEEKTTEIKKVFCKTIRVNILEWKDDLSPKSLKIVWKFMKMSETERKTMLNNVDRHLKEHP